MSDTIRSVEQFLREAKAMTDKFLHDFSAAWGPINPEQGGVKDIVPQSLHNETVALQRKQEKSPGIAAAGLSLQMDTSGNLTIIQSGSHYIVVAANQVQEFISAVNSLTNAPAQPVIDLNTDRPVGLNLPMTNQQMSMRQNELTLKHIKQRR